MNRNEFPGKDDHTSGGLHFEKFEEMIEGLKGAINKFQDDQSPENFAAIITSLQTFGVSGADVWNQVAGYIKRHPIQSALVAGLTFFAFKGITAGRQQLPERSHKLENEPVH